MSRLEVDLSLVQHGRGVSLPWRGTPGQLGTEIPIGRSPGPGTHCSVFLATNNDHAYDGATLNFYVAQFESLALFESITINAADNAAQTSLAYDVAGCAADHWEVRLVLNGGATPASELQGAVTAQGVENPTGEEGGGAGGVLTWIGEFTGASGTGPATFTIPTGSMLYQVAFVARVSSGAGGDVTGATYSTIIPWCWENTGGTVAVPGTVTFAPPFVGYDATLATTSVTNPTVSGGKAAVPFTLPASLNAATKTVVTVTLTPMGSAFS